jgi:hypothetical protein
MNTLNSVKAPSKPHEKYLCVLKVTDDDGNSVCDTVIAHVALDPPRATASALSAQVPVECNIDLLGSAKDLFGKIIKWEWDVGNTGLFIETTPDSNYTAKAPGKVYEAYPCVLRVTDDDSVVSLDTINININLFTFYEQILSNEKNFYSACPKDINRDGKLDFLISYSKDYKIGWLERTMNTQWIYHEIYSESTGPNYGAAAIAAHDMDGDNDVDIIGAFSEKSMIMWFENTGNQQFTSHLITDKEVNPFQIKAADLDKDNLTDILVISSTSDKLTWYRNAGTMQFTPIVITTNSDPEVELFTVVPIDFDRDSDVDIVVGYFIGTKGIPKTYEWFENVGGQTFIAHKIQTPINDFIMATDVVDLDGDSDIDLISKTMKYVTWAENDGTQNFTRRVIDTINDGKHSLKAADFDGDNDLDILCSTESALVWYENVGKMQFVKHFIGDRTGYNEFPVDVDGNGTIDVVYSDMMNGTLGYYLNMKGKLK